MVFKTLTQPIIFHLYTFLSPFWEYMVSETSVTEISGQQG